MTRDFPGGVHLQDMKHLSCAAPIAPVPLAAELVFPLQQHIGEAAEPVVTVGERVRKGQMIAAASGYVSVPVHASTSGKVVAIEPRPVPHPSGLAGTCIVVAPDGEEEWVDHGPVDDFTDLDPSALRNRIRDAGIVGLGGGGFPTFIKLNPGPGRRVDTVILNGVECEPYITCDDRLMRERAAEVVRGAEIIRHAVAAERCLVGVEDNKAEAAAALRAAAGAGMEVRTVPTRYPAGGEKQLIKTLTGREVPADGLPLAIGVVMQNVATAAAVHHAVDRGEPLVTRVLTVTGPGVARPGNYQVHLGTPVAHLLAHCGLTEERPARVIIGGPMMGFALQDTRAPVIKTSNCVLVETAASVPPRREPAPCIRCGACVEACPVQLLPQQLYWYARAKDFDKVQDYHLFDCIECGCCAYVCPSNIPLVGYYRFAKTEIWTQERERAKSDVARRRHEFHVERLEREQAERATRLKEKKAAAAGADPKEAKKAAVAAALERAQARKSEAAGGAGPGDAAPPESGADR